VLKDDFNFHVDRNRPHIEQLCFLEKKKKENGWMEDDIRMEDDFTCNVVFHSHDLTLFDKKNFNEPYFINLTSN